MVSTPAPGLPMVALPAVTVPPIGLPRSGMVCKKPAMGRNNDRACLMFIVVAPKTIVLGELLLPAPSGVNHFLTHSSFSSCVKRESSRGRREIGASYFE